ncbi:hypothetical protein AWC38_SpisGene16661 [Stylophora pistillata]|uniref:Uncharacterized protein n=1 Tax=Stylophora pistillata TaxID=50429 RepID=A0A2B4RMV2_STYPI|nr:hypothetical protein AWC38_SpisGene16661 [Stylophora pistillata]
MKKPAITVVIVMGAILAIQYTILVFAVCCKVWERANRSRSDELDSESLSINRFPFLPSYEVAMRENRTSPPNMYTTSTYLDACIVNEIIQDVAG